MSDHIKLAIADLERKLEAHLTSAAKLKSAINLLSETIEEPLPYPDADGPGTPGELARVSRASKSIPIRPDEFYGKPLSSAVRQVLVLQAGPTTVEGIYAALQSGGFSFEARDEENQLRGLAVSISKNSALFARLPNGLVGLAEWYDKKKVRPRNRGGQTAPAADTTAANRGEDDEQGARNEVTDADQEVPQ